MDLRANQRYYENLPDRISVREDRVKLWWKDALSFAFEGISLADKTILEIGAGKGILDADPAALPRLVVCTDISLNRFRMNRYGQTLPGRSGGVCNDLNSPCFQPGAFDIVVFVNCLMFAEEKVSLVESYKALLKPDGLFVIVEPLRGNPFYLIRKAFASDYDPVQIRNMTYRELEAICGRRLPVRKRYFYMFSVLTAPLFLRFPESGPVRVIHAIGCRLDSLLLRARLLQRWAILGCAVIPAKGS